MIQFHDFSAEKLHCPDCSKTFKSKTSLENHKSVHKPSSHYQVQISFFSKLIFIDTIAVPLLSDVLPESRGVTGTPSRFRPSQGRILHCKQGTWGAQLVLPCVLSLSYLCLTFVLHLSYLCLTFVLPPLSYLCRTLCLVVSFTWVISLCRCLWSRRRSHFHSWKRRRRTERQGVSRQEKLSWLIYGWKYLSRLITDIFPGRRALPLGRSLLHGGWAASVRRPGGGAAGGGGGREDGGAVCHTQHCRNWHRHLVRMSF